MADKVKIVRDCNGIDLVVIPEILFRGKRKIEWDQVKDYLLKFIGHKYTIKDTQDEIYIEKDLPDEYAGSKYTYSLMGANAKAKANAVQGLPELLKIAKGKHYRENSGKKHIRNAAYGWYRFDSRFAIPVYNGKENTERYNVYHASLLVRHAKDGRLYLYDMIDIKKETGNPF